MGPGKGHCAIGSGLDMGSVICPSLFWNPGGA